ncbi:unnamed protein product [Closterium sp. NIES-65]|nr:unnamed protein product [Closterium sp. NIES-65]CAI6010361.1 unnamed protein product [Closterium sp. NIES-65]
MHALDLGIFMHIVSCIRVMYKDDTKVLKALDKALQDLGDATRISGFLPTTLSFTLISQTIPLHPSLLIPPPPSHPILLRPLPFSHSLLAYLFSPRLPPCSSHFLPGNFSLPSPSSSLSSPTAAPSSLAIPRHRSPLPCYSSLQLPPPLLLLPAAPPSLAIPPCSSIRLLTGALFRSLS